MSYQPIKVLSLTDPTVSIVCGDITEARDLARARGHIVAESAGVVTYSDFPRVGVSVHKLEIPPLPLTFLLQRF